MASPRDPSSDQLNDYKKKVKKPGILLTASGIPVANKSASLTVGPNGPLLMQDVIFLDEFSHFSRERIPERTVHAKGAGAFGYFEVTHDISKYSKASVFSEIGKKTPIFVRFSTVPGENDSPDTVRTVRGFAVKFYTEQGIWDLIGNNTPIFFLRDPMLFPSLIHTQKRNPVTHLSDLDMYWDFLSLRPETTNQVIRIFADEGIPDGYRYMDGHGVNTFKLVNRLNESYYCKFHYKSDQGKKYLFAEEAARLTAINPDYATKDLYNSIAKGEYPSWTFYIQVMTLGQADSYKFNPFDATKVWPESEFPLIPVGKLVLNRNPENYFADVEQAAFNPQHMPPGIEASPDKVLQGRLLAYGDAQRHRVGPNHLQLAVNCPYKAISSVTNYQRDGFMSVHNQDGAPNYFPNSFRGPVEDPSVRSPSYHVSGDVARHEPPEDDYSQAGDYWRKELSEDQRARCVRNLVDSLRKASVFIIERSVGNFASADAELGRRLIDGLRKAGVPINAVARSASL